MSKRTRKGYQKHRKRHHRRQRSHKLSDHFSKRDFKCKHCDEIKDCKKTFKLSLGLIGALELLRTLTKNRINILKGYECLESNEKRKIFKKNYHTMGLAGLIDLASIRTCDVICRGWLDWLVGVEYEYAYDQSYSWGWLGRRGWFAYEHARPQ